MTVHHVTFDLDDAKRRLDEAIEAVAHLDGDVVIDRATWVMARSLCDEVERLRDDTTANTGGGDEGPDAAAMPAETTETVGEAQDQTIPAGTGPELTPTDEERGDEGSTAVAAPDGPAPTSVVLEVHRSKRTGGIQVSISVLDETGAGHGFRLYGTKFCACHGCELLARKEIDRHDANQLRQYLDRVQG